MNHPFAMLFPVFHIELAIKSTRWTIRDESVEDVYRSESGPGPGTLGTIASAAHRLVQTPATLNFIARSTSGLTRMSNYSGKSVGPHGVAEVTLAATVIWTNLNTLTVTYTCRQAQERGMNLTAAFSSRKL